MKALTWKEPFASLMLHGKIETRTWNTNYRGLVLICAGKRYYSYSEIQNISGGFKTIKIRDLFYDNKLKQQCGMAIAIGTLVDSRPMKPEDEDRCFVQYHPDLYCHVYTDVFAIEPFAWKGSQGWKNVPQYIINSIKKIV